MCKLLSAIAVLLALSSLALGTANANAAAPAPGWSINTQAIPSNFSAADNARCLSEVTSASSPGCDEYVVTATNAGSEPIEGSQITLSDTLPEELEVQRVSLYERSFDGGIFDLNAFGLCTTSPVRCEYPGFLAGTGILPEALPPGETLRMVVYVTVKPSASGALPNTATVSGGGASEQTFATSNQIASTPPAFGPSSFDLSIDGSNGTPDTQAGSHPYELNTRIDLTTAFREPEGRVDATSTQDIKDVVVDLPLGFVGSILAAPTCTLAQLSATSLEESKPSPTGCPPDTQVGHIETLPREGLSNIDSPLYNMKPEHGYAAEFGYIDALHGTLVFYASVVPSPSGYLLQVTSPYIPQIELQQIDVSVFGDPAERDAELQQLRQERKLREQGVEHPVVERERVNASVPYFTNPTGCSGGELTATVHIDSWRNPGSYEADGVPDSRDPAWASAESKSPPVTGCNALRFAPELGANPTTNEADSPSGLEFALNVPQFESFSTLATPALRNASVTFPPGFTLDPSAGDGLKACSEAQIGWLGGSKFNFSPAQPECPEASKIGALELTTPLIPGVLHGEMYLASQNENPFGSAIGLYVVVDDPTTGVLIKLPGEAIPNPQTGRITAIFEENPQLPFSELKMSFFGGPRAEFATPTSCGSFTTTGDLEPWSSPDSGPDATPFDNFGIDTGCVSGFAPAFTAGSTNLQAGAYTPFVASFSREDTDQELGGLSVSLPPGLLADVAGVPLCGEAQANAGTCPEASQIGTVLAGAGAGPNPLFETGRAYLTGPYNGGPYGLSVVVPAIAGPFDFGDVVVRQSLRIDRHDAHVTDVSNPFPTILNATGANGQTIGIPIRLRRVDVDINRPGFTFNPTSCGKLQAVGSITSTEGATSTMSVPFQVTNCATLKFKPKFTLSTSARTSRLKGASLSVKLTYPKEAQGAEANLAKVKVELPKRLPSRLSTLQKACAAAQFEANPSGCPAASVVGYAKATTPILAAPLEGPAYFVSHGGEAFPSLIVVLQGDGITVELVGTTFISKKGITSSTFKAVPDVPVGTFELTLPEGNFSALAAPTSLCTGSLAAPTEFIAQDGAVIHQSTKITVTNCRKARKRARKAKRRRA